MSFRPIFEEWIKGKELRERLKLTKAEAMDKEQNGHFIRSVGNESLDFDIAMFAEVSIKFYHEGRYVRPEKSEEYKAKVRADEKRKAEQEAKQAEQRINDEKILKAISLKQEIKEIKTQYQL